MTMKHRITRGAPRFERAPEGFSALYVLIDPIDHAVKYVGQSVSPNERWGGHCGDIRSVWEDIPTAYTNTAKQEWIMALNETGHKPILNIVDYIPRKVSRQKEYDLIVRMLKHGAPLVNQEVYVPRTPYGWDRLVVPHHMTLREYLYPQAA